MLSQPALAFQLRIDGFRLSALVLASSDACHDLHLIACFQLCLWTFSLRVGRRQQEAFIFSGSEPCHDLHMLSPPFGL